jgi:poly-gamma-glutamate capsule biosynthesis protein CapA/YwtB (metallophosphatase superfamily)
MPADVTKGRPKENTERHLYPILAKPSRTSVAPRRISLHGILLLSLLALSLAAWAALRKTEVFTPLFANRSEAERSAGKPGLSDTDAQTRTLLFVGDIMLARGVGRRIRSVKDPDYPFLKISPVLHSADLLYGNLECPVSDRGRDLHHLYSFRAAPNVLEGLKYAGFTIVSQANNHAYDWGKEALLDSLRRVREAGIRTVGAGQNALEAHYPVFVNVRGVRLAFLAYVDIDPKNATAGVDKPGVAWLDPARVLAGIRFARPLADLVIVCPHWGVEYSAAPTREQVGLAHQMINAGADLIVGSHPHVSQPLEHYKSGWIAYSLGNFIFDQKSPATHHGLILKVGLSGKRIQTVETIPILTPPTIQAQLTPLPPLKPPRKKQPGRNPTVAGK